MELDWDTKILNLEILKKLYPQTLKHKKLNPVQEQILLRNMYYKNCLVPILYIIGLNNKYYFLRNSNVYFALKRFITDNIRIELDYILGNYDKELPLFSELKSADKRRFLNYEFYTRMIYVKTEDELEQIISNSELL